MELIKLTPDNEDENANVNGKKVCLFLRIFYLQLTLYLRPENANINLTGATNLHANHLI
jgi:hypothetical protein